MQDKYIALYKELITQLHICVTSIRILAKGCLPISLITPSKLKEILSVVKMAIRRTNPDYDLIKDRLHLYERNLIIHFPVFIQPYTQPPLILYQIELVPVPITDQNTQPHSYTHLQINKPYIALTLKHTSQLDNKN